MAEKKQNNSLIVQNMGVGSKKNTFEGKIQYLPLDQLEDFKNHPFKVEMNAELFELMQSIEKEGVLVPLLYGHTNGQGNQTYLYRQNQLSCYFQVQPGYNAQAMTCSTFLNLLCPLPTHLTVPLYNLLHLHCGPYHKITGVFPYSPPVGIP